MEELLKVTEGLVRLDPLLVGKRVDINKQLDLYKSDLGAWKGLLDLLLFVGFELLFRKNSVAIKVDNPLYGDKVYKGDTIAEALFNMFMQNRYLLRRDFYCNDCYVSVLAKYKETTL